MDVRVEGNNLLEQDVYVVALSTRELDEWSSIIIPCDVICKRLGIQPSPLRILRAIKLKEQLLDTRVDP